MLELYWTDLTIDAQKKVREFYNMDEDENGNWDVFPIIILEKDE